MPKYSLTRSAEVDLLSISIYGDEQFGPAQSDIYLKRLFERFSELALHPLHFPKVDQYGSGYRKSVCGSHSIYYRTGGDGVVIVRILGRQDISTL